MDYESYSEVLDFLENYFKGRVKSSDYLKKLENIIEGSRREKTVAIRAIHQIFINYTEEYKDYVTKDKGMGEVWEELLDIWQ